MIYQKEISEAAETVKALVEGMKDTASNFTTAMHMEHIMAMFKVGVVFIRTPGNEDTLINRIPFAGLVHHEPFNL